MHNTPTLCRPPLPWWSEQMYGPQTWPQRFMRPSGAGSMNENPPKKYEYRRTHRTQSTDSQNKGTAFHAYLFGGADSEVMPFPDKRTKAAKEWWAACIARGNVPLKKDSDEENIYLAAAESRRAIIERYGVPESEWICEKTFYWTAPCGTPCRGTTDLILPLERPLIIEGKSWDDCDKFPRQVGARNWDAQRAGYIQAVAKYFCVPVSGVDHVFLAQELGAPYCLRFVPGSWDALDCGGAKWDAACLKHLEADTTEGGWEKDYDDGLQEATPWDMKKWGDIQV